MAWQWGYRFRRTTLLTVGYGSLLLGIGLATHLPHFGLLWLTVVLLTMVIFWHPYSLTTLLGVVWFGLMIGAMRGDSYQVIAGTYAHASHHYVTVTIQALDDAVYGSRSQLSFTGGQVFIHGQKLPGRLQVSGFGLSAIYQGDLVQATGRMSPGYGGSQGSLSFAHLQLIGHRSAPLAGLRRKFAAGMDSALPEPLASFAMGLLIGQRSSLSDDVKRDLLMVGLTHIVAVSGYNLTIMLHASRRLLAKRSKRLNTWLSLSLVLGFLLLSGASASIVRAAIVSVLSIIAGYYGRRFKPLNLILLAAAISAWMNPFYLWGDLSWYLSFLAFYGILVLAPIMHAKLPAARRNSLLINVAIESICAEIMTLPIILFAFGQMSLVGLPANLLVVTLVPLAMLLSFVAGLAGMGLPTLAGWLAWPAKLLLTYMLDIAHFVASLPHVFVQNLALGAAQMLTLYAIITVATWLGYSKTKVRNYAKITDHERT